MSKSGALTLLLVSMLFKQVDHKIEVYLFCWHLQNIRYCIILYNERLALKPSSSLKKIEFKTQPNVKTDLLEVQMITWLLAWFDGIAVVLIFYCYNSASALKK